MSTDLRIALTTSLNDKLVAPLRRSLDEVERNLKEVERELLGVDKAGQRAGTTLMRMQGPQQASRQAAQLARETERAITLADRLKSSWNATGSLVKGVASGVAAFQAARMVVAQPLQKSQSYDMALAHAANTAFSTLDKGGRIAGMRDLDDTVKSAMRSGGGTREDTLGALNEMLASGSVSASQAKALLPVANRYATAGDANVGELSTIIVRALQSGFKEADIPKMMDKALAAGQAGGFELKDMAKWLPKFLAAGQVSGLTGMEGYERILASAQGSVTTAGSKDEAGNNLLNLLLKINSSDTAQDAKKLGIDLSGSLAAARGKGVNSLDAFVNLVDKIAAKDSRLVSLRKQAANAGSDEERKTVLNSQADILQGSAIGKIVQDRQALLPLIAELNRRDYITGVQKQVNSANGQFGAANFDLVSQRPEFKVKQAENEKLFAQTTALEGANTALGKLSEHTTDLYQKYPGLASAMEAAKLATTALAAAAGGAAAASLLLGGGLKGLLGRGVVAAGGGAAAAAARSGIMNASPSWTASAAATAAPGALAAGVATGAAIGATALGAAVVGAPILATGMYLSDKANSPEGLRDRISTRNTRISELDQMIKLEREGGGGAGSIDRLSNERQQMARDRDALLSKYHGDGDNTELTRLMQRSVDAQEKNALAIQQLATRPVQISMDGREVTGTVNDRNAREARRN